jgi:hypothetical protein
MGAEVMNSEVHFLFLCVWQPRKEAQDPYTCTGSALIAQQLGERLSSFQKSLTTLLI